MDIQLVPGERILWQGSPPTGFRVAAQDLFAIPFSVVWLGFVLVIFGASLSGGAEQVDPVAVYFILPVFLLVGLYFAFGRFLADRRRRRRTRYLLTDRRALIESGMLRTSLQSVSLAAVPEIRLRKERDRRGSIQFGASNPFHAMLPPSWPGGGQFLAPVFEGVEDAERVYKLAVTAQQQGRAAG